VVAPGTVVGAAGEQQLVHCFGTSRMVTISGGTELRNNGWVRGRENGSEERDGSISGCVSGSENGSEDSDGSVKGWVNGNENEVDVISSPSVVGSGAGSVALEDDSVVVESSSVVVVVVGGSVVVVSSSVVVVVLDDSSVVLEDEGLVEIVHSRPSCRLLREFGPEPQNPPSGCPLKPTTTSPGSGAG
jgi:hypothetical protein